MPVINDIPYEHAKWKFYWGFYQYVTHHPELIKTFTANLQQIKLDDYLFV